MHDVVTGALVRDGRVLLVHRGPDREAFPDVWDLPGGHVEADESEVDALARELREEIGVGVEPEAASHLGDVVIGSGAEAVRLSVWLVRDWCGEPVNAAPEEHDDLGWFKADEVPPLVHPAVERLVRDVLAASSKPARPGPPFGAAPQAR